MSTPDLIFCVRELSHRNFDNNCVRYCGLTVQPNRPMCPEERMYLAYG